MVKKTAKKASSSTESDAVVSNGAGVYETALDEIKTVGDNEAARRKVESGPLKEGRGNDVLRLHTTLKAIDSSHSSLAGDVETLHSDTNAHFEKTWESLGDKFEKTWGSLDKNFEKTWESLGNKFEKTWDASDKNFEKTWDTINSRFDKTWETLGHNFDATNERTKREVADLRDELTKILDKRFTHIDQTFASIRADIEVVKALQMELIKERIGRPELLKR